MRADDRVWAAEHSLFSSFALLRAGLAPIARIQIELLEERERESEKQKMVEREGGPSCLFRM